MSQEPFNKAAKERERARQADDARRELARRRREQACAADNGHVYGRDGRCVGCNHYSPMHNRSQFDA